jgi:hypothetical protein
VNLFGFEIRRRKKRTPRRMVGIAVLTERVAEAERQVAAARAKFAFAQEDERRLKHMLDHPDEPLA